MKFRLSDGVSYKAINAAVFVLFLTVAFVGERIESETRGHILVWMICLFLAAPILSYIELSLRREREENPFSQGLFKPFILYPSLIAATVIAASYLIGRWS